VIGFSIGVLLYLVSGLCDYRCEYCGAKEYGQGNVYYGRVLCDRCFSEFEMVRAAQRRNAIIGMTTDEERKEYILHGTIAKRVEENLERMGM